MDSAEFLAKFEAWSRAVCGHSGFQTREPADIKRAIAAHQLATALRSELPEKAEIHGLYPGFEKLGGAYARQEADGGGILMAVVDLAIGEAAENSGGKALNWQHALSLYGPSLIDPMLELLREAAESGAQCWCRWEYRETPTDADGEPVEDAEEQVWAGAVWEALPDGKEEACLTWCQPDDAGATLVKQVSFEIEGLGDVLEEREQMAARARRGEVGQQIAVNTVLDRVVRILRDRPFADARELIPDVEALRPEVVDG